MSEELRNTIRHQLFLMLNQSKKMKRNDLEESINVIVSDLEFPVSEIELKNKISEIVSEIISKGEAYSDGYIVSIRKIFR